MLSHQCVPPHTHLLNLHCMVHPLPKAASHFAAGTAQAENVLTQNCFFHFPVAPVASTDMAETCLGNRRAQARFRERRKTEAVLRADRLLQLEAELAQLQRERDDLIVRTEVHLVPWCLSVPY